MPEAGLFQSRIEVRVDLRHLLVGRYLEGVQNSVRHGRENEIGLVMVNAILDGALGIEIAQAYLHQRVRFHDMGGGALHHGNVSALFPQGSTDVVGGIVGADDHAFFASIGVRAGVLARVVLVTLECGGTFKFRNIGNGRHARGEDQLLGLQGDRLAIAHNLHHPFLFLLVIFGRFAGG